MYHGDPMFSIDSSGHVRNVGIPDRETKDVYIFTILAQDLGAPSLSSKADYNIKVLDVNDNSPICARSHYRRTIKENIAARSNVIQVGL